MTATVTATAANDIKFYQICKYFIVQKVQKMQKKGRKPRVSDPFWSECRDSNSGPLEPHSSAIPNFATPGNLKRTLKRSYILLQLPEKSKCFFLFSENFFWFQFSTLKTERETAGAERASAFPQRIVCQEALSSGFRDRIPRSYIHTH